MGHRTFSSSLANGVLLAVGLVAVATMVHREFFTASRIAQRSAAEPSRNISNWQVVAATGHRLGGSGTLVTIVEFGDYECPVCASYEKQVLGPIRQAYPKEVTVVFRNWPLPYHRLAYPAARAAECAGRQGRYTEYHDLLYREHDSLGLKSFVAFANQSGVPDTTQFSRCYSAPGMVPAVDSDVAVARELGGDGTPTLVINGTLLGSLPNRESMDSIVRAAIGHRPQ